MGWGEPLSRTASADMVKRNNERMTADALAAAVSAFLDEATTGNWERLAVARDSYRTARCAAATA